MKAVHLEVVSVLTSEAFIEKIRHVSRGGDRAEEENIISVTDKLG